MVLGTHQDHFAGGGHGDGGGLGDLVLIFQIVLHGLLLAGHIGFQCALHSVGLALGGGFYEGGIAVSVLVLLAELVFSRLEYRILDNVPEINLYMEYSDKDCLENVLQLLRQNRLSISNMEITRSAGSEEHNACAIFALHLKKGCRTEDLIQKIQRIEGVVSVEEI